MTLNGAAGATETAMEQVLALTDWDPADINGANRTLLDSLASTGRGIELSIANSLWLRDGFPFHRDFVERCTEFFSAHVENGLDADRINAWVKEKTREKIPNIIDAVKPEDIAYLINAVYFKGIWSRQFDPDRTKEDVFHITAERSAKVPLMRQSGEYRYCEEAGFQAVALPYGDGAFAMYLFLPAPGSDLDSFLGGLSVETWDATMKRFAMREGSIALPRFRCEYAASLVDPLAALGMEIAFSPRADFSRMCDLSRGNVSIADVIHKTFVEVNEEGTEAAAATAVKMKLTAAMPTQRPFTMIVDRPFFFAIRDEGSGAILFMGSITDPTRSR
jgi:serpin B